LRTDLQRKKLVSNTLNLYDGLKVFFVRSEVDPENRTSG